MIIKFVVLFCLSGALNGSPWIDTNRMKQIENTRRGIPKTSNFYSHAPIMVSNSTKNERNRVKAARNSYSPLGYKKTNHAREDPRLFYLSDTYLRQKNFNYEAASVFPGRDVVRADSYHEQIPMEIKAKEHLDSGSYKHDICVKCPQDRTLVAKAGYNRVILQKPARIFSCGRKLMKDFDFEVVYGPKFGSLLGKGSHTIVGRLTHMDQTLQYCKMQVHVITQECSVPKILSASCKGSGNICTFSCNDPKHELLGPQFLSCDPSKGWSDKLPTCKARTWCQHPPPPEHGWISCKALTAGKGNIGLGEGSKCRVKCPRGWTRGGYVTTFCRRGSWTHNLTCLPNP